MVHARQVRVVLCCLPIVVGSCVADVSQHSFVDTQRTRPPSLSTVVNIAAVSSLMKLDDFRASSNYLSLEEGRAYCILAKV